MKHAGYRRHLVYPEESRGFVILAQANVPFKVSKSVVWTSEKNTHVLVTDWGVVSLEAVV